MEDGEKERELRGREGAKETLEGRLRGEKKGLVNTIIIFKNISGAAAACAKNRAKSLDDSRADRRSRESRGVRDEERTAMGEGYKISTIRKHDMCIFAENITP